FCNLAMPEFARRRIKPAAKATRRSALIRKHLHNLGQTRGPPQAASAEQVYRCAGRQLLLRSHTRAVWRPLARSAIVAATKIVLGGEFDEAHHCSPSRSPGVGRGGRSWASVRAICVNGRPSGRNAHV